MTSVLVLDNGGYSIKFGLASADEPKLIPNCITKVKSERRRLFIGDQIDDCKDFSSTFYLLPTSKGYITNFELQKQIWDYSFKSKLNLSTTPLNDLTIILTQPYLNFKSITEIVIEMMFEDYNFGSVMLCNPAYLSLMQHLSEDPWKNCPACLVVDSGYSFTHIIPYVEGKIIKSGIRRIDVGGKLLTNYLKDIISYRQLHVLDETHVMNQCKEDACYISQSIYEDLKICSRKKDSHIVRDYVLPDFTQLKRGYVKDLNAMNNVQASTTETASTFSHKNNNSNNGTTITSKETAATTLQSSDQQCIRLNNERVQVPEILFFPSDVGINQIGISHAIVHCVESFPEEVRAYLYENILLIGGNAKFAGFEARIKSDVRSMVDSLIDVNITVASDPITDAWHGGKHLANTCSELLSELAISREDYEANGMQYCIDKFDL